jgi:N-acetylglutamate synthase-like GNAT family acetyltransferase
MMEFRELKTPAELDACAAVVRESFSTVAEQFRYTPQNAPTFPAFITGEKLLSEQVKAVRFFGAFEGTDQLGCVALEQAPQEKNVFFLERLAVLPRARHRGLGVQLMDYVFGLAKKQGGTKVKIAMVDENRQLKDWYTAYGFRETGTKQYPHLPFLVCFMEKPVH